MALSINQILVVCLIVVLVAFVVVMAIMAVHAIGLIKKSKELVNSGNKAVEDTKAMLAETGDKVKVAAGQVVEDSTPAVKAVACLGAGIVALSAVKTLARFLLPGFGSAARERRKAAKEIRLSKKTIRKMSEQARLEREAAVKANKLSLKQQKKIARTNAKASKKMARKKKKLDKKLGIA